MPIYEFKCTKCGNEFEEILFGSDDTATCPACGSGETERLMSCCRRHKSGGVGDSLGQASSASSGCAGCSGGNCSTCGS